MAVDRMEDAELIELIAHSLRIPLPVPEPLAKFIIEKSLGSAVREK